MQNGLEVTNNFIDGLALALSLDGSVKTITFSDGSGTPMGRITKDMLVLWLTDQERIVRTHSHGLNFIVWNQAITMVAFASDVPANAALAANCYLDVDGKQYRIDSSFVENQVVQVDLQVFRTSNH
jgi:hypothetical protein